VGFTAAVGVGNLKPGIVTNTGTVASPFDGQVVYETDNNRVMAYDGSSWETVGPTGLVLVSTTTIGSAVSSVTVSNAFSATYDNYKIIVVGGAGSTSAPLYLTLGATATGYYYAGFNCSWTGTSSFDNGSNAVKWMVGRQTTDLLDANFELLNPYASDQTVYVGSFAQVRTDGYWHTFGGYLNNTTSYTDFTIAPSTGTMTGGEIRVYGYKN